MVIAVSYVSSRDGINLASYFKPLEADAWVAISLLIIIFGVILVLMKTLRNSYIKEVSTIIHELSELPYHSLLAICAQSMLILFFLFNNKHDFMNSNHTNF